MFKHALIFLVILPTVVAAAEKFKTTSVLTVTTIAGRPIERNAAGKLLPWPMPDNVGYSYSSHIRTQWGILWDQYNRQRYPYFHCCFDFDRTTFEMQPEFHWANSTAYLRAMMQGFVERLYPFTGDQNTLVFLKDFMDYELANGLTPEGYAWPKVPYTSANPGDRRYTGWSRHGEDYLEPPIVGEDGYAYLRFYEMTGNTRYLQEALRCAQALAKNYRVGDVANSPWPVRCYARDGKVAGPGMGEYSANVVEPIILFDELIRVGQGDVATWQRIRDGAWKWLHTYPMQNNVWVGYFEDVPPTMANMNQVIPLEYARYILLHPEKDPAWRENSRKLIDWVKTTPKWPKYVVDGATVTTEQGNGITFCCGVPNECCDSHTSRLAAVEALYYLRTGDETYKEAAFRSYNWVTYFQGMPPGAHAPFGNQWWFTDEFSDGPRRLMDGFWAIPEWAPADESHLLGSDSVVTQISYGSGSVTYSTFDPASVDVLRLNFVPMSVWSGGRRLTRHDDLAQEGYTLNDSTHVLRIRHDHSGNVDIEGVGEDVPLLVDFDNPHLGADAALSGQYPSGVIDWGTDHWKTCVPGGRMSTFSLCAANPKATTSAFRFTYPKVMIGLDIYNPTDKEVTLLLSAPEAREVRFQIGPGRLKRVTTGWRDRVSMVTLESDELAQLMFDNLAYSPALWAKLDEAE